MEYDLNKQFKISQYTPAAAPCKINEGGHQQNKKNAADYAYYLPLAIKSMNNHSQNSNTQTSSCGKHFQTAKHLKYGLDKQFKISQLTAAVAPCKINEGDYQQNTNKCGRLFILCSPGNQEHEK